MTDYGVSSEPACSGPEEYEPHSQLLDLLAVLGIVEVTYSLDGGGDSGECELALVRYADGREEARLPSIPIGFATDGEIFLLSVALENMAADLPEGDWVNNEGGHGTVRIFPMETDGEERIVCDMTYRDEEDFDDEDEETFDFDFPEDETADNGPLMVGDFDLEQAGADQ